MKQFSWNKYYNNFYDCSLSTQKKSPYGLTNFGSADEVYGVIAKFSFYNQKFSTRFVEKRTISGACFTSDCVKVLSL
ncbi:MAG: hypothetical protein PUG48_01470 [Clostridia bacterium]|nr:hypothetical protein [Clostridia bacterium]